TATLVAAMLLTIAAPASTQTNGNGVAIPRREAVVLRPGDVLRIDVWPNQELGGNFVVEESGLVYLPFLGSITAAGTTIDDLRVRLRNGYAEAIQNPVVTVSVIFQVGVLGEVVRPGVFEANPTTTFMDAIGMAGGFSPLADQER